MPLHPDYGLHLLEQGLGHIVQHFYSLPLDHLTLLGPGQGFTTLVNLESSGQLYAASFDIPDKLWEDLLGALPEDVVNEMVAELEGIESVPRTVELSRVVRVQVAAWPGRPQRGSRDTFVPLVVERIESAEEVGTGHSPSEATIPALPFDAELMTDIFAVGAFHFEAGTRRYEPWSARIIEDVGEGVRPYLRWAYAALRHWPGLDTTGMDSDAEIDAVSSKKRP
jgi:hypothetical protein